MSDFFGIFVVMWVLVYLFQAFIGGIVSLFSRLQKKPPVEIAFPSK